MGLNESVGHLVVRLAGIKALLVNACGKQLRRGQCISINACIKLITGKFLQTTNADNDHGSRPAPIPPSHHIRLYNRWEVLPKILVPQLIRAELLIILYVCYYVG